MDQKIVLFQRQELYNEVWSEPMTKLAKKYEISDNGLRKICIAMGIPLPLAGHWAKKAHKKKISIRPLPPNDQGKFKDRYKYVPIEKVESKPIELPAGIDLKGCLASIQKVTMHPLVIKTEKAYDAKSRKVDDVQRIWEADCLDVAVSKARLPRALGIMDTILKVFESLKMPCGIEKRPYGGSQTYAKVQGETITFEITEKRKRIDHVKTPDEIRRGAYTDRWDYFPSGELVLTFKGEHYYSRQWKDGKLKLEDRILEILAEFFECSKYQKRRRIEWAEAEKRREEERKIAAEIARQEQEEEARQKELEEQAINWNRAVFIHNFVKASEYEFNQVERTPQEKGEYQRWSDWAHGYADMMNPFKKKWYQR